MRTKFLLIVLLMGCLRGYAQEPRLVLPVGHTHSVNSIVFSPNSKYVLTASDDKTAKIWDLSTGDLLLTLIGHTEKIKSAAYSTDGKYIITTSFDGTAKIWNSFTGSLLNSIKGNFCFFQSASFSPDGKYIITANSNNVAQIWDAKTCSLLHTLKGHNNRVVSAQYSFNGTYIITASTDSCVKIWDAANGNLLNTLADHSSDYSSASFSPDGESILTVCNQNKKAKIWNFKTGILRFQIIATSAAFSNDGKYIVTTSDSIKIWYANTGTLKKVIPNYYHFASISPDNKKIVAVESASAIPVILNVDTKEKIAELKGYATSLSSAIFSTDSKYIVTGSSANFKIWNAVTATLMLTSKFAWEYAVFNAASFSDSGKYILTANSDGTSEIWDAVTGLLKEKRNGYFDWRKMSFSRDKKNIVLVNNDTIKIVNVATGNIIQKFHEQYGYACASYSSNAEYIATGTYGGKTTIWNANNGNVIKEFNNNTNYDVTNGVIGLSINEVSFSPDNKYVATCYSDNSAAINDALTGKLLYKLNRHSGEINSCIFSPNGKYIITSSDDATAKIWNAHTGKEVYTFFPLDTADYFAQLPNKYYKCSPNSAKLLHYVTPDLKVITFEQLDVKYNRPDKVLEAIGNTDTALIGAYRMAYYKRIHKLGVDTNAFHDGFAVPEADFANRDELEKEYDKTDAKLLLHITGKDSADVIDRYNVYVNGSPLYGLKGVNVRKSNKRTIDKQVTVTLSEGKNIIETSVTNANGIESYRKPLQVSYTPNVPVVPKVYFIGIGANHFASPGHDLQYCVKDIRDLAVKLYAQFGSSLVVDTLFNEQVNPDGIIHLKNTLLHTTVNDKVIIAYSGHGLLSSSYDYYLSAYNINFSKPQEGGLPYDALEGLLDSIPARKKLLLIDACNSGEVDKEELARMKQVDSNATAMKGLKIFVPENAKLGMKNSFELMQDLFVNVGRNTGATVIAAAGGIQAAQEKNEWGHGAFTYSILEYLQQHAHAKVSELNSYVNSRVPALTQGLQQPTARQENLEYDWEVW